MMPLSPGHDSLEFRTMGITIFIADTADDPFAAGRSNAR